MSWDRDEAGSLLELMGTLTDRMRDLHDVFTSIHENSRDTSSVPRGNDGSGSGIDVEAITEFTEAIRDATPQVVGLGKEFDALAEKIGNVMRERDNVGSAIAIRQPGESPPAPMPTARPAVYDQAPAAYYSPATPTKPNLPDGMYSPIKTAAQADKWLFDKMVAEHGLGQGAAKYMEKTTPSGEDLLALIQNGVPMNMAGKFAQQQMRDNILQVAQRATAVPVAPKPPKPPKMSAWQRAKPRIAKGVFYGGVTGGLRGAVRGGIVGAGLNLFTNPAVIASGVALAMPKIMAMSAEYTDRQVDVNRRYAGFAPETMNALVNYDVNSMFRNMELAKSTSKTAVNLINTQNELRDAMMPFSKFSLDLDNTISTAIAGMGKNFFKNTKPLWDILDTVVTSDFMQNNSSTLGGAALGATAGWLLAGPWGAAAGAGVGALLFGEEQGAGLMGGGMIQRELDKAKKIAREAFNNEGPVFDGPIAPRPRAF